MVQSASGHVTQVSLEEDIGCVPEAMQEVIGCIPSGKTFIISTIPDQERKYQITVLTNHLIHIGNPSWQLVAYLSLLGTRARDGKGWQVGVVPSRSCCHRAANRRRPKLSICHKVHTRPGRPDLASARAKARRQIQIIPRKVMEQRRLFGSSVVGSIKKGRP